MLTAAVIGTGMAGSDLAAQLQTRAVDVRIVAGVDVERDCATDFCARFGGRPYTDVRAMADAERPDLVVIASSNDAHADNACDAIEGGIANVYCEKPIAIRLKDAQQMVETAELHGTRTSVGFSGLEGGIARMIEIARSGLLGRILHLSCELYRGYGFWGRERINRRGVRGRHAAVRRPEVSGGWTVHHACHMIYVLTEIAGPVSEARGTLIATADAVPSEEIVSATLRFESGAVGTLLDSIGSFRGTRYVVIGTAGTLVMTDQLLKTAESRAEVRVRMEGADEDEVEVIPYRLPPRTRLQEFVDAILANGSSPVTFRAAMENLRTCQAIRDGVAMPAPFAYVANASVAPTFAAEPVALRRHDRSPSVVAVAP